MKANRYDKWENVLAARHNRTLANLHKMFPRGYTNRSALLDHGFVNIALMVKDNYFTGKFTRNGIEYWVIDPTPAY